MSYETDSKSLPPFRARAIARDHLSHLFLEIKNNIDYYLRGVYQQIDLKIVIYSLSGTHADMGRYGLSYTGARN